MKIPGLVDLQVNGYRGVDFSSPTLTREDLVRASQELIDAGTTAFLPTLITSPLEVYRRNLPLIAQVMDQPEFRGRILGIHIEGPFISKLNGARGAHNLDWVLEPDVGLLQEILNWANGKVKLLTIAADIDGSEEIAKFATSQGVTVSLGHQMADEEDLIRLVQAGAKALTHLGNGIPGQIDRHNNPVWAGLANDDLSATIITDGHHLPTSLIKTILRTKGPERCIVISDATMLAGFEPGQYESMNQKVILEETGRLYNPQTGYLVGSSATILDCMNHLASLNLVNTDQLLKMGFENPLRLIGLSKRDCAAQDNVCYNERTKTFTLSSPS